MFYKFFFLILICCAFVSQAFVNDDICQNAAKTQGRVKTVTGQQEVSFISYKKAKELFEELKKEEYKLPYLTEPEQSTNCYLRAHRVSKILNDKYKIKSLKSFLEAKEPKDQDGNVIYNNNGEVTIENPLVFKSPRNKKIYSWAYHTATAVCVLHNGKPKLFIFDHSLYDTPVEHHTWVKAMTKNKEQAYYGENYLTTMYNMNRVDPSLSSEELSFKEDDLSELESSLNQDWEVHQNIMKKIKAMDQSASKTQKALILKKTKSTD